LGIGDWGLGQSPIPNPPFFVEVFYSKNQCLTKIGEKVFDYDYELKDSESFWDLYNENGIIVYMNNLPSFANYSETLRNSGRQMRLYTKNYHGINSKCLEIIKNSNLSPRLLSDLIAMSNDSLDVSGLLTFSIIFGSIGVGWMCVYVFTYWVCLCCTECTKLFNFTRLFVSIFPSLFNFTMVVIWGLGIGDWGLGPQSPIPNPQSPNFIKINKPEKYPKLP
jgi:hypothetical protein